MHCLAAATMSAPLDEGTCKMDLHADTSAVGSNFVMLENDDGIISVHPFAEEYKTLWNIPIATVATVWTDSKTQSYLLVFHKALFFGNHLQHSLICPNQLHANGITIHDVPCNLS